MSAVYYTNIKSFADNLVFIALTNEIGALIAEPIQDWIDENEDYWALELSEDDINALLKALSACVVATRTDMNCYPLGLATADCFDLDGNPL
jgi:hypothetical protein